MPGITAAKNSWACTHCAGLAVTCLCIRIEYGPDDDLPEVVARRSYELLGGTYRWEDILSRKRRQIRHRAKRWLNTDAVDAMTTDLLAEQDPDGDVVSWLEAIQWLMGQ